MRASVRRSRFPLPEPSQVLLEHAQCRGEDPSIFFPPPGGLGEAAKVICARCPVVDHCLEYAIAYPTKTSGGVWGGLTESERRAAVRAARRSK
jgi:WhiB family redox-sensing transcriptional regulator